MLPNLNVKDEMDRLCILSALGVTDYVWFSHVCAFYNCLNDCLLLSLHRVPGAEWHHGSYVMP